MNFKSFIYIAAVAAACIACKKKEDEYISLPTLNGNLEITGLDEFLAPNAKITLEAEGVSHPKGEELGYYWQVLPSMSKSDTTDIFEFEFSDTLRTYTIYCTAFAEGYTSSSLVAYTTLVKNGKDGSIQGIDALQTEIPGTEFFQITIGDQTWMQNNLYSDSKGTPYRDAPIISNILGKYYTYEEAKDICASALGNDWTLPSKEDWEKLDSYIKKNLSENYGKSVASAMMADATFNLNTMWEYWPKVGAIKNGSGFSAIPIGYASFSESANVFDGFYQYATFWTSTETEDGKAYYKYLYVEQPDIFTGIADKNSFGAAVRCIKK